MSLKNAALLALIGTILLTILKTVNFVSTFLGFLHDIIPAMRLLVSLIELFAIVTLLVFFCVFHRSQH
jgi:hypothetical protein